MSDFGDWILEWKPTESHKLWNVYGDAATVLARQYDALDRTNCVRVAASKFIDAVCRYDGPGGLPRKEWCRVCIAKHAAEEFMEKMEGLSNE